MIEPDEATVERLERIIVDKYQLAQVLLLPNGPSHLVTFLRELRPSLAAIGSDAGRDAVIELRPRDEWHEDFGFALWYDLPIDEAPYVGSPLCDDWPGYHTHWCKLPNVAAPPSVRAPASPEKAGPIPPARIPECVTPDGLRARADIMRERGDESCARHLELAADEIERLTASPAASDLRERADNFCIEVAELPDRTSPDEYPDMLLITAEIEFAAIRAEAKAEGWEDAVKALGVRSGHMVTVVTNWAAQAAKWLAAHRPTGRED